MAKHIPSLRLSEPRIICDGCVSFGVNHRHVVYKTLDEAGRKITNKKIE